MSQTAATLAHRLLPRLSELRQRAIDLEQAHAAEVEHAHPNFRASARNLLHYLALRQTDMRGLQVELARLGLSRMARAEAHVLASLDAVICATRALAGTSREGLAADLGAGEQWLLRHGNDLLGHLSAPRHSHIMVTMPSQAASEPALLAELLRAGMSVMRINCAHDDSAAWLTMIANLRQAERETGLACRILADLAGPKLRTGEVEAVGQLVEMKVKRDALGRILQPARIWITPRSRTAPAESAADTVLPIDDTLVTAIHAGDHLEVEDSRGGRRLLAIKERFGDAWLAHCFQHAYIADGAPCTLYRGDDRVSAGVAGPLPDVVPPIVLRPGDRLMLTTVDRAGRPAVYDDDGRLRQPATIPCTLPELFETVLPGQAIWFDDGKIGGRILARHDDRIEIEIDHAAPNGSKLRAGRGINLPDTALTTPALTGQDCADLALLASHIDMVGLSFVRRPEDVLALQAQLAEFGAEDLATVLKIETRQGFENLPAILLAAMRHPAIGVMMARGDLAVEVGFERLSEVQEEIVWLSEAAHIPVIWATQVLESMVKRGLPTRAEVTDAAMSSQAECVMLNKGAYIIEATRFLAGVLNRMTGHHAKSRPMMRRLSVSQIDRHQ